MVQSRTRLAFAVAVAVAVVLAASVACTNNVQGTGSGARPKPSQKVAHPVTSSVTPSPTPSAAGQRDGLSVTAVRAYPGGLVLAAAEAGAGVDQPMRVLVSRDYGAAFTDVTLPAMHAPHPCGWTTWSRVTRRSTCLDYCPPVSKVGNRTSVPSV